MRLPGCLLLAALVGLLALPALAQPRVALVIGNAAYTYAGTLPNPSNDARDIAAVLSGPALGFQVELLSNQDRTSMQAALRRFSERARRAEVALFYYAGHAIQGRSEDRRFQANYLLPVDAQIRREADLPQEALTLDAVLNSMEGAGTALVFLDACRDNPLARQMERLDGTRGGASRGLVPLDRVQVNTLVAFATLPGDTAADGGGRNSPFTAALLRHIADARLEVRPMLGRVREQVWNATNHEQLPETQDRLLDSVYLAQTPDPQSPPPHPQPPAPSSGYPVAVGQVFRDCPDCMELVVIPPGRVSMGSPATEPGRDDDEGPLHDVVVDAPLAVGRYHVTVAEYRTFVTATGRPDGGSCWILSAKGEWGEQPGRSWRSPGFAQTDRDPVVCVSWEDAQAYARWLSGRTGRTYRLLTEAEWEYAARAVPNSSWWWGTDATAQCRYANGADQTARESVPGTAGWTFAPCPDGFAYTSPVGRFAANGFGLSDMAGNAWQWVEDCYVDNYNHSPTDAGRAVTTPGCTARVLRGGSWSDAPQYLRAALRGRSAAGYRGGSIGFRLARTPGA